MDDDEKFFEDIEALAKVYANEAEDRRGNSKKVKIVKKVPMLLADESEPLNTILICRYPEERILIVKEFSDSEKRKK
ncbi:MAG: hypothetical protein ACXQS5_03745 [Candidatus Methanospirareceae archaeon]